MKRTIMTSSFIGSAAAGLIAAAIATPAFAQQTTYPAGTDCTKLSTASDRTACTHQMNESRQNPTPGDATDQPNTNVQPGSNNATPNAAPNGAGAGNGTGTGTTGGAGGTGGTGGGASQ
jgi:hypothetical protein